MKKKAKAIARIAALVLALVMIFGGSNVLYKQLTESQNAQSPRAQNIEIEIDTEMSAKITDKNTNGNTEENVVENTDDIIDIADITVDGTIGDIANNAVDEQEARRKAPAFTVLDTQGNEVVFKDLPDKPLVLNLWASWCPPYKEEMQAFQAVYDELGDEVQFIMIDAMDEMRETQETGADYIAEQFTFPVYLDINHDILIRYKIVAVPTTIFIDKDGFVVTGVQGAIDEDALREGIAMILEE